MDSTNKDETDYSQCSEKRNSSTEDFAIATILMLAYCCETFVQIYLIVDCYRSSHFMLTSNWLWILLASWIFSSLLVTIISIVWTLRGMDFSGRLCGQLLCYIMHFFLLGFLWRYLKLSLAYEKADAEEFSKLRTLQIYVQALPLIVIHLVCIISPFQGYEKLTSWMVAGEVFSAIISLALYSLLKPKLNLLCEVVDSDKTPLSLETNVTSRILLLISRVIAVGLFASVTSYWSLLAILVHLIICQTWIYLVSECAKTSNDRKCFESDIRNELDGVVPSPSMGLVTCTYILFWDVNSTIVGGINLRSLSLPVLLVLVENVAIVIFHLHCQTTIFFTIASGSCLLCGSLLLLIVPTWNKWSPYVFYTKKTNGKKEIYLQSQGLPVVDPRRHNGKYENEHNNAERTTIQFFDNGDTDHRNRSLHKKSGFCESNKNGNIIKEALEGTTTTTTTNNSSALQTMAVTNDYQRINETLMTTVNKVSSACYAGMRQNKTSLKHESSSNKVKALEAEILSQKMYENTWGSSSSRNTNTISDFTPHDSQQNDSAQNSMKNLRLKAQSTPPVVELSNDLNEIYEIQQQSPPQIRKASKVLLNNPKHQLPSESSQNVSRCLCLVQDKCEEESENNIYEKLIEDAYGILICEGDRTERCIKNDSSSHSTPIFHSGKRLKVLCAKCLENHDPLLSDCIEIEKTTQNHLPRQINPAQKSSLFVPNSFHSPGLSSETTEYPTDTEFTCNLHEGDELSISTHMSTVHSLTYTNLPIKYHFSHFITPKIVPVREIPKELTGLEYVRAWLMMNDLQIQNESYSNNNNNSIEFSNRLSHRNRHRSNVNTYSSSTQGKIQKRPVATSRSRSSKGKFDKVSTKYSCNTNNNRNPVLIKFQPPPKQKQHPSSILNNNNIKSSNCKAGTLNFQNRHCKYTNPKFYHIQSDLLETIV